MKKKVKDYENSMKKKKNLQSRRESQILDIKDTGEPSDIYKEFIDLKNEILMYKHRIEKLKKEQTGLKVNYLHIKHKINEMKEYCNELKRNRKISTITNSSSAPLAPQINELQRILRITNEKYDASTKILTLKIKQLENEFKECRQNEMTLNESLITINQLSKANQESLAEIKVKSVSLKTLVIRSSNPKFTI